MLTTFYDLISTLSCPKYASVRLKKKVSKTNISKKFSENSRTTYWVGGRKSGGYRQRTHLETSYAVGSSTQVEGRTDTSIESQRNEPQGNWSRSEIIGISNMS